ncbi:MAG TPA: DUF4398 domain-containing protein [Rhodospirillaceae bacterium]|nr:DUF4398 domain-containing protein [Rhodospirillaceae bacterium]
MPRSSLRRRLALASAACASFCLVLPSCAGPPPTSLVQARGEVNEAVTAPPGRYSPPQLQEARLKLDQANGAADNGDQQTAGRLAEEALADLRLSRALGDSQQAAETTGELQSIDRSLHQPGR